MAALATRPVGVGQSGLTPNQFGDPQLSSAEAYAACGPAAAIAFARAHGRNPTLREALDLAKTVGWTASQGMAGPRSQVALLEKLGVPAVMDDGVDWSKIARDVQAGNPVIISTPMHYFVAEGFDQESGKFDFGASGTALRAGRRWMSPQEVAAISPPRASIFLQSPGGNRSLATTGDADRGFTATSNPQAFTPYDDVFRQHAQKFGLGDNAEFLAVVGTIALAESGLNAGNTTGDSGRSWGLFQIHEVHGKGDWRLDPNQAAAYMMPRYAETYRQAKEMGLTGKALASFVGRIAQRPAGYEDPRGKAAVNYENAWQRLTSGAGFPQGGGTPTAYAPSSRREGFVTDLIADTEPSPYDMYGQPQRRRTVSQRTSDEPPPLIAPGPDLMAPQPAKKPPTQFMVDEPEQEVVAQQPKKMGWSPIGEGAVAWGDVRKAPMIVGAGQDEGWDPLRRIGELGQAFRRNPLTGLIEIVGAPFEAMSQGLKYGEGVVFGGMQAAQEGGWLPPFLRSPRAGEVMDYGPFGTRTVPPVRNILDPQEAVARTEAVVHPVAQLALEVVAGGKGASKIAPLIREAPEAIAKVAGFSRELAPLEYTRGVQAAEKVGKILEDPKWQLFLPAAAGVSKAAETEGGPVEKGVMGGLFAAGGWGLARGMQSVGKGLTGSALYIKEVDPKRLEGRLESTKKFLEERRLARAAEEGDIVDPAHIVQYEGGFLGKTFDEIRRQTTDRLADSQTHFDFVNAAMLKATGHGLNAEMDFYNAQRALQAKERHFEWVINNPIKRDVRRLAGLDDRKRLDRWEELWAAQMAKEIIFDGKQFGQALKTKDDAIKTFEDLYDEYVADFGVDAAQNAVKAMENMTTIMNVYGLEALDAAGMLLPGAKDKILASHTIYGALSDAEMDMNLREQRAIPLGKAYLAADPDVGFFHSTDHVAKLSLNATVRRLGRAMELAERNKIGLMLRDGYNTYDEFYSHFIRPNMTFDAPKGTIRETPDGWWVRGTPATFPQREGPFPGRPGAPEAAGKPVKIDTEYFVSKHPTPIGNAGRYKRDPNNPNGNPIWEDGEWEGNRFIPAPGGTGRLKAGQLAGGKLSWTATEPRGWSQVPIFKDGVRESWLMPTDMVETLMGMNEPQMDMVGKMFARLSQPFRLGITAASLPFLFRNMPRDVQQAAQNVGMGFVFRPMLEAGLDLITGGLDDFMSRHANDPIMGRTINRLWDGVVSPTTRQARERRFEEFLKAGGPSGTTASTLRGPQSLYEELEIREGGLGRRARDVFALPITAPINAVMAMSDAAELTTRYAVFKMMQRRGATPLEAARSSRTATTDFSKGGNAIRALSLWMPLLNAREQGTLQSVQSFSQNPEAYAARLIPMVVVPTILTYAYNRTVWGDLYDQIPLDQRDRNHNIILGEWTDDLGRRKPITWAIPKNEVSALISTPLEHFMDGMLRVRNKDRSLDPKERTERSDAQMWLSRFASFIPVNLNTPDVLDPVAWGTAAITMNPVGGTILQLATNRDVFRDQKIVPESQAGAAPEYRTGERPAVMTRLMGQLMKAAGISEGTRAEWAPAKLAFAVRGFGGTAAQNYWGALDIPFEILQRAGIIPEDALKPVRLEDVGASVDSPANVQWNQMSELEKVDLRPLWTRLLSPLISTAGGQQTISSKVRLNPEQKRIHEATTGVYAALEHERDRLDEEERLVDKAVAEGKYTMAQANDRYNNIRVQRREALEALKAAPQWKHAVTDPKARDAFIKSLPGLPIGERFLDASADLPPGVDINALAARLERPPVENYDVLSDPDKKKARRTELSKMSLETNIPTSVLRSYIAAHVLRRDLPAVGVPAVWMEELVTDWAIPPQFGRSLTGVSPRELELARETLLKSRSAEWGVPVEDLRARLEARMSSPDEQSDLKVSLNQAYALSAKVDRLPRYAFPNGTPAGVESEWGMWDVYIEQYKGKKDWQKPTFVKRLEEARAWGEVNRIMTLYRDERYPEYQMWFGVGRQMHLPEYAGFENGTYAKYIDRPTLSESQRRDVVTRLYRALPDGSPTKQQMRWTAREIAKKVAPGWRAAFMLDEYGREQGTLGEYYRELGLV